MENKKIISVWHSLFLVFALVVSIWVVCRIVKIQLSFESESQTKEETVKAKRGAIYSIDGKKLAETIEKHYFGMDCSQKVIPDSVFNSNVTALASELAGIGGTYNQWLSKLKDARNKNRSYVKLFDQIDYATVKQIEGFPIFNHKIYKGKKRTSPAIDEMRMERMRYFEKLAKRTVGRVDMLTNHGLHGLELYYDSILIGQDGVFIREQYSDGIWTTKEEKMPLKNGSDLISTIDISIQDVAETSLKKVLEDNEAEKGIVVLMEVATGNVLSIVTLTRDSKDSSSYDEVWNNAIGTYMEQGSTMKLATLIAVLEEGKLGLEDKVKGNQFAIKDRVIKDSDKHDDILTLRHAFEISSNAAFADAAVRSFNKNKFYDYLVNFNLDRQLGVDLIGEADPLLKKTKDWSDVSLAYIAHGYEIEVTPMQVLTLYNAIANNGVMVKPKFLTAIVNGNDTTKLKTEILNPKICSDETVKKVQECLVGVVKSGTSKALSKLPFSVAGKTGTAVTNYANKGEKKKYRASFVGYFPAENPKYTCYVMIEEPSKGKKYGAELAVPVFKNIVEKVYAGSAYLAAPITKSTDSHPIFCIAAGKEMQNVITKMGYQVKEGKTSSFWQSTVQSPEEVAVLEVNYSGKQIPNLVDFSAKDAVYILEKLGLNVKINGKGRVKEQSITAGENIVRGSTIYLRLG